MPGRGTPPLQSPAMGEFSHGDANNHNKAPDNASPPQAALTEAQKRDFHILVVEDNAINQQIALKTIRNLGFSVSAVWNGKEALDYLLKAAETAQSPNPANSLTQGTTPANSTPLPNVILMDVQMPILDGYRATHTLRYHAPFKNIQAIQKIPIVAMTASAIQGDREKCKRAGMDDYISKPTPRNKLEKIILKWTEGAVSTIQKFQNNNNLDVACCGNGHSSDCPGSDYPSLAEQEKSSHSPAPSMSPPHSHGRGAQRHQRPHLDPTISEEKIKSRRTAGDPPASLSEADRGLRRAEAEEQAANLRDEKLLAATEMGPYSPLDGGAGAGVMSGGLGSCSPLLVGSASAGLPFSPGSPLVGGAGGGGGEAYSDQRAATNGVKVMALTEENVERLNADRTDADNYEEGGLLRGEEHRLTTRNAATSTKAIGDGDGDDDDDEMEMDMDLARNSERRQNPFSSPPITEYDVETNGDPTDRAASGPGQQQQQRRFTFKTREGRLSAQDRRASDWSESTAKPGRRDGSE